MTIIRFIIIIFVFFHAVTDNCLISAEIIQSKNISQNLNANSPSGFIENKGQWSKEIRFLAKMPKMNIWITDNGIVYDYFQKEKLNTADESSVMPHQKTQVLKERIKGLVVKTDYMAKHDDKNSLGFLENFNSKVIFVPSSAFSTNFNYMIGNDKSKWVSNVAIYKEVLAKDVFPGIDARYYIDTKSNNSNKMKNPPESFFRYDFIVNPGANVSDIRIKSDLGNPAQFQTLLNNSNELVFSTNLGELIHRKPYSYQINYENPADSKFNKDESVEIKSGFVINKDGSIGFQTGEYDKTKPLVIDPLVFSSLLGGNYYESPNSIVMDGSGNIYLCGSTYSSDFPRTTGAYDSTFNGYYDTFVSKFNADGSTLMYSTFIGGSDYDYGTGIEVDYFGNAFITGYTYSTDFPLSKGALFSSNKGYYDCFVLQLNSSGTAILNSTYFGGSNYDYATKIALDTAGNVCITGYTNSTNLPIGTTPYRFSNSGGYDCFYAIIDNKFSQLLYSTYIGGSGDDYAISFVMDIGGNAFITGYTNSRDFTITGGVYSSILKGGNDCFVLCINPNNPNLIYSSYLGGSSYDYATSIAIDGSKNAYITGYTLSSDFPTTTSAISNTSFGNYDCFVTKLNNLGSALAYSTYIGGSNHDYGTSIAVNSNGNAFVAGNTYSSDFQTTTNALDVYHNGSVDGFLLKLNPSGSTLAYSSFFGGVSDDYITDVVLQDNKNLIFTGSTYSIDLPTTAGTYNRTYNGYSDGFVSKISDISYPIITGRPYYYSYCASSPISIYYSTDDFKPVTSTTFTAQLSDLDGTFNNPVTLGSLASASSGYINGIIPANTPLGYKYRVRVVSTKPDYTGNDNGYDIAVYNLPTQPKITKSGKNLVSSAETGNQWYLNSQIINGANLKTYTPVKSGLYSVTQTLNSCPSVMSDLLNVVMDADKLTALFGANPTSGMAPLIVSFTDSSTGSPTNWLWEFGDNQTSTAQNPTHTYTKSGSYTVKLTASNGASTDTRTIFSLINVVEPMEMTADFLATPTNGDIPLTVQFTDNSTGSPVGWIWDFGDNKVSTEANPVHVYEKEGVYTVTLKAMKGSASNIAVKTDFIKASIHVSVTNIHESDINVQILPSLNNGIFVLKIENSVDNAVKMKIIDEIGREVYSDSFEFAGEGLSRTINLSNFKSGIYFVKLKFTDCEITKKIIITG